MSKLLKKKTGYTESDFGQTSFYPNTIVEAIIWDGKQKKLEDVLTELGLAADGYELKQDTTNPLKYTLFDVNGTAKGTFTLPDISVKQDTLVSGENIKTINGQSIVGGGNFVVTESGTIPIDNALSSSSENAVQNKVITGKVTELEQQVGNMGARIAGGNFTNADFKSTYKERWYDNSGVAGVTTSGAAYRVEPIAVIAGAKISASINIDWAAIDAAYFCDNSGNIIQTISRNAAVTTFNGVVPSGATNIRINYLIGFTIELEGEFALADEQVIKFVVDNYIPKSGYLQKQIFTDDNLPYQSSHYWANSAGKVVLTSVSATAARAYSPVPVIPGQEFNFLGEILGTGAVGGYFADKDDNIVYTISQNNGIVLSNMFVPENSAYFYPNYRETNTPAYNAIRILLGSLYSSDRERWLAKKVNNAPVLIVPSGDDVVKSSISSAGNPFLSNRAYTNFIPFIVVSDSVVSFSANSGYNVGFYFYDNEMNFISGHEWYTISGSVAVPEGAYYMRFVIIASSAFDFSLCGLSLTLSQSYSYTRAASENLFTNISEIPIVAPAPQLSADGSADSDFDAETLTPAQIYDAFDTLLENLPIPAKSMYLSPKYATLCTKIGRDATNTFDIKSYVFSERNRYAWKHADMLFAWKNGGTIVYINSVSPLVGMTIYSDAERSDSGAVVSSFDVANNQFTSSGGTTYTRSKSDDVPADVFFTEDPQVVGTPVSMAAYNRAGISLGTATKIDSTHLSLNSKSYERCPDFDYHTSQRGTIFMWFNEHGPQSDPAECAIVAYRMAKDLCDGCRTNPFLMWLKKHFKIVMMPCANPYGMQNHTRNNGNNVNINRNYSTPGWAVIADTDKGAYAGDQPETQYIMNTCLMFEPSVAVDSHCLGYVTAGNEGRTHYEGFIPSLELLSNVVEAQNGLSFRCTSYGGADPDNNNWGGSWLYYVGISGGLIEMNAGPYAAAYDGEQHKAHYLLADYTLLLGMIRCWLYGFDPTIDLSGMHIQ